MTEALRCNLPMLTTLNEEKQRELFARAKTLEVDIDDIIFEEGDIGHSMYFIKYGAVRVLTTNEDGQQIILASLQAGNCFGEQAVLSGRTEDKRHISVIATESSQILKISLTDFQEITQGSVEEQLKQITDDKIRQERDQKTAQAKADSPLENEGSMEWLGEQLFKDGEVIFQEGDANDEQFYLILDGTAQVSKNGQLQSRLSRGQYFGETALVRNEPRPVTVIAEGSLRVASYKGALAHDQSQFSVMNNLSTYQISTELSLTSSSPIAYKHFGIGELAFQIGPLVGITAFGEWADVGHLQGSTAQTKRTDQVRDNLVNESSLFRSLPVGEQAVEWMEELQFSDGAIVFQEGDTPDRFYFILSGMARVTKKKGDTEKLEALLCRGQYFGEVALIRNEPRAITVTAEGPLRVASLKGLITFHTSKFMEMDSLTTMYHFPGGKKIISTKVVDQPIFDVTRVGATLGTPVIYKRPGTRRELFFQKGELVGITAIGEWGDLGRVNQLIIRNRRVWPWQIALFHQKGELWLEQEQENFKTSTIICKCTGVTRGMLSDAIGEGCDTVDKLSEYTGASRVCGSCAPKLAEMVGHSDMDPVNIVAVLPVTQEVKSFRFRPKKSSVFPSKPGQHIRIEALIAGRWVQRSYTLTSSAGQEEYYEITVKREEHGLFSRWLHDDMNTNSSVRVSKPRGEFYLPLDEKTPVIGFAGGIGVTPSLAMLRTLNQMDSDRALYIDYSAQRRDQFAYFQELLETKGPQDNFNVNLRATEEHGFLQAEEIKQLTQKYPEATHYICGPKPFEQAIRNHLGAADVPEERIKTEQFVPAGGSAAAIAKLPGAKTLVIGSLLTFMVGLLFMFTGPIPYSPSVQADWQFDWLWTDNVWKQVTGYTILALTAIGMAMSFRKRWRRIRNQGNFAWWRLMHLGTGLLALALLFAHTGMTLGEQFNLLLMLSFLGALVIGSVVGLLTFIENRKPEATMVFHLKTWIKNAHIAIVWPLPVLIGIHIVMAYYF